MSESLFLDFIERAVSESGQAQRSPLAGLLSTTQLGQDRIADHSPVISNTGFQRDDLEASANSAGGGTSSISGMSDTNGESDFVIVREPPSKINRWMMDPPFQPNAPTGSVPSTDSPGGILTGLLSPLAIPVAEMLLWDAAAKGLSASINAITEHLDAPRVKALKAVYDGLIAAVSSMDTALKVWAAFAGRPWTVEERNSFETLTIMNVKYYKYNLLVSKAQQLSTFRSAKDSDDSFGKKWSNITTGAKKEDLQAAIDVVGSYKTQAKDLSDFIKNFCDVMVKAGLSDFQGDILAAGTQLDSASGSMKDAFPEETPQFIPVPGRGGDGMQ